MIIPSSIVPAPRHSRFVFPEYQGFIRPGGGMVNASALVNHWALELETEGSLFDPGSGQ